MAKAFLIKNMCKTIKSINFSLKKTFKYRKQCQLRTDGITYTVHNRQIGSSVGSNGDDDDRRVNWMVVSMEMRITDSTCI
jgi:hypothetical protein